MVLFLEMTLKMLKDLFTATFAWVDLKMNADKTEHLLMNVTPPMSSRAYVQTLTGVGMPCQVTNQEKINCNFCGLKIGQQNLNCFQSTAKCSEH
jgi:hypothetical protein